MRHNSVKLLFILLATLCLNTAYFTPSRAQEQPAVEVDMSVLNAMQPAAGASVSSKPAARHQPLSRPVLTRRAYQSATEPVSAPSPQTPVQQVPSAPIVTFPVTVKERSEAFDPSLEKTIPTTAEKFEAETAKPVMNPPLPDLKPVAISTRRKKTKTAFNKTPIPPRRPTLQKASAAFVQEARMQAREDLSKPGMAMPAVPPQKVEAEPLKAREVNITEVASANSLAHQLIEPDKDKMIKSIETVASLADALLPAPPSATTPSTAAPVSAPVPPEKPEIKNPVVTKIEKAIDITAMEPAAGIEAPSLDITEPVAQSAASSRPEQKQEQALVPRSPPAESYEEEYVTVPFQAGLKEIDEKIISALEEDIVPLLQSNPDWRVQIQAFASNNGDTFNNARRLSLSRALAIRSYLLEKGITSRRMDVRALGMQTDRTPTDRVDFVFFNPDISE